jgi:chromosome segregation ATPase
MQLLESLTADIQKLKNQKKKSAQKFEIVAERLQQTESANEQLNVVIQKLENDNCTLSQDHEALTLKHGAATSFNIESESSPNSLAKDLESKPQVIHALEGQVDRQRAEIEAMATDRQNMLDLVYRLQKFDHQLRKRDRQSTEGGRRGRS